MEKKSIRNIVIALLPEKLRVVLRIIRNSLIEAYSTIRVKPKSTRNRQSGNNDRLQNSLNPEKIDVLMTCWLGVEDILLNGIGKLHKEFYKLGVASKYIVSSKVVETFLLNHGVSEAGIVFESAVISRSYFDAEKVSNYGWKTAELNKTDSFWVKDNIENIDKINRVYAYWKKYLSEHDVKHMIIWGNTAPMSVLFLSICKELDIEYSIIERGHFSGTMLLDSVGQFGFGSKQKQITNSGWNGKNNLYNEERMKEILHWIHLGLNSQYVEKNKNRTKELDLIKDRSKDTKVVVFFGANDLGTGMKSLDAYPRVNTWFKNSQGALDSLIQVLPGSFTDVLLVLKPHPSAELKISDALDDSNIIYANETSIIELIKAADVCIAAATTVIAYCVALGKPTLQFGITDFTNKNGVYDIWHPSMIIPCLRDALDEKFAIDRHGNCNEYIIDLFDNHLIKIDDTIPAKLTIKDMALHLFNRIHQGVNTYHYDIINNSEMVSKSLFNDVAARKRKTYDLIERYEKIDVNDLPGIAVIIPVYDDLPGLKRCVESVVRYQADNNNYEVQLIWDRGPNNDVLKYCRDARDKYNIHLIENRINVGFSGTVNKGILKYKKHDIILLNSDTIVHGDWALRMQQTAYSDREIATVNPLSNNATLNNVPFYKGTPLPADAVKFVEKMDSIAQEKLQKALEVPVSHGFCVFLKRSIIDITGLFDEYKFGKGHSEDNEYSMRVRSKGFKCVTSLNVFVGHDGSTSFKDELKPWQLNGREIMQKEFPFYFDEIRLFFNDSSVAAQRKILEPYINEFF